MHCPEENTLVDFVCGELGRRSNDRLEAHIDRCDTCQAVLAELARLGPQSADLLATSPSPHPGPRALSPADSRPYKVAPRLREGAKLGRYIILQRVGSGGMGVVYAAYDPELDRKVAIKLMMVELGGSLAAELEQQRTRLLREAQAMARLSHPNVITVHDVGEFGDHVFVAMEFIDGETLTDWMKRPRSWREVLSVYAAAGHGLAAAHAADLVHRDFKPDNILIGEDRRVLVTDFGLARPAAGKTGSYPSLRSLARSPVLSTELTRTGALVGTRAFMAPEQFSGGKSDASADQFSFCVALYAALYGERPFAGRALGELMENVGAGNVSPAPRDANVPRRIRRVLLRGLSVTPTSRFPNMKALLAALDHEPLRAWRRWAAVILPSAVLATGLVAYQNDRPATHDYCDAVGQHLDKNWGPAQQDALQTAFEATQLPYASSAWKGTKRHIDRWSKRWLAAENAACQAESQATQPQALLALRMRCLAVQKDTLETFLDLLSDADASMLQSTVDAARRLPQPQACDDIDALARRTSGAHKPEHRAQLEALDQQAADARVLRDAGRFEEAERMVEQSLDTARQVGDPWSEADLLTTWAELQEIRGELLRAEQSYHDAMSAGLASENRAAVARVAFGLLWLSISPDDALENAQRWYKHGLAALGTRDAFDQFSQFESAMGLAYLSHQKFEQAEHHMVRSLDIVREHLGPDHPSQNISLSNLGQLYAAQGRRDEAIQAHRQAADMMREEFGPLHPLTAASLENLGVAHAQMGDLDAARPLYEQALQIRIGALGRLHPANANTLLNLGILERDAGDPKASKATFLEALAIVHELRPGSLDEADILKALGTTERVLGELPAAVTHHRAAHAMASKLLETRLQATYKEALARSLLAHGELETARAFFVEAEAILAVEEAGSLDHTQVQIRWALTFPDGLATEARAKIYKAAEAVLPSAEPLLRAEILWGLSNMARASRDRSNATQYASRASKILDTLGRGADPLRDRMRRESF